MIYLLVPGFIIELFFQSEEVVYQRMSQNTFMLCILGGKKMHTNKNILLYSWEAHFLVAGSAFIWLLYFINRLKCNEQ